MSKLELTLGLREYDRVRPLLDGRIEPEGIDLRVVSPIHVEDIFWRMLQYEEFDVSEMSTSAYLMARSRGHPDFIAIPVFPARIFRHSSILVNTNAGIREPRDLIGRRVGVPEYHMTVALWARGILQHEYGVTPDQMRWFKGGLEQPGRGDRIEEHPPAAVSLEVIPAHRTLKEMLSAGDLDAVITPQVYVDPLPNVARLFPNFKQVEREYYRKTKMFPIMHTVVFRRSVYDRYPWAATSLCKAFCAAKDESYRLMQLAARYPDPWFPAEMDEVRELMGDDPWPYGLEANRHVLEAMTQYSYEQGLSTRKLAVEELFAPNTLSESKI